MAAGLHIRELITKFNKHKDTLEVLFGNRNKDLSVAELVALEHCSEQDMAELEELGLVTVDERWVSLDERFRLFLEDFLEIGEVNTGFVNDSLNLIEAHINLYKKRKSSASVRTIRQGLQRMRSLLNNEVKKLYKLVDEAYKSEPDYAVKKAKLEIYRRKRDELVTLIENAHFLFSENAEFFYTHPSFELNLLKENVEKELNENHTFLTEIQFQIIEYLKKVQYHSQLYDHIRRLRELRDLHEFGYRTNAKELLEEDNMLFWTKTPSENIPISFSYLYSDKGQELIERIRRKLQRTRYYRGEFNAYLPEGFDKLEVETLLKIDTQELILVFANQSKDLFEFLEHHNYAEGIKLNQIEKLTLYVELSIDFDEMLIHSDKHGELVLTNDQNEELTISYQKIYGSNIA